jgi:hypothetical protein
VALLLYGSRARRRQLSPWLAGAAVAGLGLFHAPGLLSAGHAHERGLQPSDPPASTLDLTGYYLPRLAGVRHVAVLSTMPMKHLARWTFLEQGGSRDRLELEVKGFGDSPEENRRAFAAWLRTTHCDRLVFVDVPPGSYFYEQTGSAGYEQLRELLAQQRVFHEVEGRDFPRYGCRVSVWERRE